MNNETVYKAAIFAAGAVIGGVVSYIVCTRAHRSIYIDGENDYTFDVGVNQIEDYIIKTSETMSDYLESAAVKYSGTLNDEKPSLDEYVQEVMNNNRGKHEETEMPKFVGAITEKMYKEDDDFEKLTGTYFKNEDILAGFNDDFEEVDPEEIGADAWAYIANSDASSVYFKNEDDSRKYEIIITEDSYDDAYEEFLANEISAKENGEE